MGFLTVLVFSFPVFKKETTKNLNLHTQKYTFSQTKYIGYNTQDAHHALKARYYEQVIL